MYSFTVHGTRGSLPVCGTAFVKYGGRTTCFSLVTPGGVIVVDAGTGLAALPAAFSGRPLTMLFTHFHLDHVMGLPGWQALYDRRVRLTLMASPRLFPDWRASLKRLVGRPFWPLPLEQCGARLAWRDLPESGRLQLYGVRLSWCAVRHPQGCLAYRLDAAGRSVVIATDYEMGDPRGDACFAAFARGADLLVYDAQYTPREYPRHRGWGHGVWRHGVELARSVGARRLWLTHHLPGRTDRQIDAIECAARSVFKGVCAAYDGRQMRWRA